MQGITKTMRVVLAVTLLLSSASAGKVAVTPVQKVIQMLGDMRAKGQQELQAEADIYAKYSKSVRLQTRELQQEIKTSKEKIEKLIATIEKADADVAKLTKQIDANDKETATLEADQQAATAQRASANEKFMAEQTDYSESLFALDRAIEQLKSQDYDRPQAMMFLQRMTKTVSGMRRVLASLALAEMRNEQPSGAPAVNAYEFQSSGIVDMLSGLKDKFRKELADLQKEEANSQHAFDMEMVHLTNTLDNLKAEREELSQTKANTAAASAAAKGDLADEKQNLAEAQKFLADMTATHEAKTATFEANQKVRKDELEALDKAVEILSSPDVSGSYGKHVNAELMQQPYMKKLSLLQMHSASKRQASRDEAARFLRMRATELNSKTLASFASKMTESNPFDKVIKMIEDLLDKLKDEAASEADHKAFCDKELKTNKMKRNKHENEVESLRSQIDQKAVAINDMAKKIATLAEEQSALRKQVSEATEQRSAEKKENEIAIKDSAAAQVAVGKAVAVLKDFYDSQGEAFVQQVPAPEMAAYKGMQRSQGGVIGMLEVIQSDFARVETDTRAAESQAAAEYKSFMADAEESLKSKHDEEFKTGLAKDEAEFAKEQLEKNHASSSKQLGMANAYYEELKPQCLEVHVSFEERAKMRQDEIEALQEAYKILDQKR